MSDQAEHGSRSRHRNALGALPTCCSASFWRRPKLAPAAAAAEPHPAVEEKSHVGTNETDEGVGAPAMPAATGAWWPARPSCPSLLPSRWLGLEVCQAVGQSQGFEVLPRRWVIERTSVWLGRCRRLSRDFERSIASAEAWKWAARKRRLGSVAPGKMGSHRPYLISGEHRVFVLREVEHDPHVTLHQLTAALAERGLHIHPASVGRFLHREGKSFKKTLLPVEQARPKLARRRAQWPAIRPALIRHAWCLSTRHG
jgi:transposase